MWRTVQVDVIPATTGDGVTAGSHVDAWNAVGTLVCTRSRRGFERACAYGNPCVVHVEVEVGRGW